MAQPLAWTEEALASIDKEFVREAGEQFEQPTG